MGEVKWIKITTNMFEDEKIDFIESLPEADSILVIWIKLLTLAGRNNAGGYIFLTESIPYTSEMLAHKFKRPLNTVKFALETLRKLEMIDFKDDSLKITNWEKHQNIDGLEKIREQTRLRVAKYRDKQKELSCNVTGNVTVTEGNATDIEEEREEDIDKDIYKHIVEYLNSKTDKKFRPTTRKTKDLIKARMNEGFTLEDFKIVIDKKSKQWIKSDMNKYLRPETLFGTKFESYLNEKGGDYGNIRRDDTEDEDPFGIQDQINKI